MTLIIIEIPMQSAPRVWAAEDEADFIARVATSDAAQRTNETIFERTTAHELLALHGFSTPEAAIEAGSGDEDGAHDWLVALASRYGVDTPLYWHGEGVGYLPAELDEFEAFKRWLKRELYAINIFHSVAHALAWAHDYRGHQDDAIRIALWDLVARMAR